jgi:hypothetical protein
MREKQTWRTGPVVRMARGLWPDHNPLRRGSDRAEAGIVAFLIGAFLLGAPLIALITCRLTLTSTFTSTNAIHDGWRQVSAVLLTDEPDWTGGYGSSVPVRWQGPNGVPRTGQILAAPGTRAGARVTVWTDASGHLSDTPMSPRQATTQADLAAGIAVLLWALTLLSTGMIGRHLLDRRRLAAWETDWRTSNLSGPAGASPER